MYCTKCGKELEDNAKFCTGCGAEVKGKPVQEEAAEDDIESVLGEIKDKLEQEADLLLCEPDSTAGTPGGEVRDTAVKAGKDTSNQSPADGTAEADETDQNPAGEAGEADPSPAAESDGADPSPAAEAGEIDPSPAGEAGETDPSPAESDGADPSPAAESGETNPSPAAEAGGADPSPATEAQWLSAGSEEEAPAEMDGAGWPRAKSSWSPVIIGITAAAAAAVTILSAYFGIISGREYTPVSFAAAANESSESTAPESYSEDEAAVTEADAIRQSEAE